MEYFREPGGELVPSNWVDGVILRGTSEREEEKKLGCREEEEKRMPHAGAKEEGNELVVGRPPALPHPAVRRASSASPHARPRPVSSGLVGKEEDEEEPHQVSSGELRPHRRWGTQLCREPPAGKLCPSHAASRRRASCALTSPQAASGDLCVSCKLPAELALLNAEANVWDAGGRRSQWKRRLETEEIRREKRR